MKKILVLGGYGNFGKRICKLLLKTPDIKLIVAGRSAQKCKSFAKAYPAIDTVVMDITKDLDRVLAELHPDIVIHTSGPFQDQDYAVARSCISAKCHYIDLADGRRFAAGISDLNTLARQADVCVISGASSVPCLTAAIVDEYQPTFSELHTLDYGITTAQRTSAGTATTAAILGYLGKPFQTLIDGAMTTVYGWQGLTVRKYPELGLRFLGYCDVPDLEIFPKRYPTLKTIKFRAGAEVKFLHLALWAMSWVSRIGLVKNFTPLAPKLNRLSGMFDAFGSDRSGFHLQMTGMGYDDEIKEKTFYLLTGKGHGPYIPCIPSVLCAQMIADGRHHRPGAYPCLGIIKLSSYLAALQGFDIKVIKP